MANLVGNEKIKLTANLINTVATAIFVAGFVAPGVAASYNWVQPIVAWTTLVASAVWIGLGTGLHLLARKTLERMTP